MWQLGLMEGGTYCGAVSGSNSIMTPLGHLLETALRCQCSWTDGRSMRELLEAVNGRASHVHYSQEAVLMCGGEEFERARCSNTLV